MGDKASDGLDFPCDEQGKRSSTGVNQGAFVAAIANVNDADAYEKVKNEKKWRFGYAKHLVKQVDIASQSPENAMKIAHDGLDYLHKSFEFTRDGKSMPFAEAMKTLKQPIFETATVKGTKPMGDLELGVPYQGKTLRGDELRQQVELWVKRGVIELDTGAAICLVASRPEWRDLSDLTFVLFGAASAMGPFPLLMALGAHVVAIDLDRKPIWEKLIKATKDSPGTITFPVKKKGLSEDEYAEHAGCNLLTQTPEVRTWLAGLYPDKRFVLGAYAYLDGPMFVRVSMAMDAVIADLVETRKVKPALAYLCTPTDAHVCTSTAKDVASQNFRRQPGWMKLIAMLMSPTKMALKKNVVRTTCELPVVDAIVKEQGPNYILAKRLQHWRAISARSKGCTVSTNIAPSTATVSVVSNKSFALAYKGMHHFQPMEVFYQETSGAVMGALLVNDLRNENSAANPKTPLKNPMQLFAATSFHGGPWRTPYTFGTIGIPAGAVYLFVTFVIGGYLALYSFGQCAAWAYALFQIVQALQSPKGSLWSMVGATVTINTYAQGLEVLHSALGMVRAPALTTAVQIASRVGLVQVLNAVDVSAKPDQVLWPRMLCIAWSLTEVVRYLYYGLSQINVKIGPVTWLRYSMFPILYPTGVAGELGCIYYALPFLAAAKEAGVLAQLVAKVGWPVVLLMYAVCFPMLFLHVLAQRKKVLGGGRGSQKSKKD